MIIFAFLSQEMGQSIQFVLIFSLLSLFPGNQCQTEECCSTKVVENSPDSSLDGTYNLASNGDKREDICIDGCVYERDGLEYCFISKPVAESADVVCDDGFTGNGLDRCIDKDECALGEDLCAENAACINTPGSFDCECKVGFNHAQSNPLELCLDLDECQDPVAYPCGDYIRKR